MSNCSASVSNGRLLSSFHLSRHSASSSQLVWEEELAAGHPLISADQSLILGALTFLQRPPHVFAMAQTVLPSDARSFLLLLLFPTDFHFLHVSCGLIISQKEPNSSKGSFKHHCALLSKRPQSLCHTVLPGEGARTDKETTTIKTKPTIYIVSYNMELFRTGMLQSQWALLLHGLPASDQGCRRCRS